MKQTNNLGYISLETFEEYREKGLLRSQVHPSLPLTIWNYTAEVQFNQSWDEITLMCRGLVTENITGKIVGRSFPKFFNLEEKRHKSTKEFTVFTKLDGSLGIVFYYEGQWVFSSRGSFTSPHAEFLSHHIRNNRIDFLNYANRNATYLFEIIHPDLRIVVNYGEEKKTVLLGSFWTKCGKEDLDVLDKYKSFIETVDVHKSYSKKSLHHLKSLNIENEEGFIIRFSNGERCKIKFKSYIEMHSIVTNLTNTKIWKMMVENKEFTEEELSLIPDETYAWIREVKEGIQNEYNEIEREHINEIKRLGKQKPRNKAEWARLILKSANNNDLQSWLLFRIKDGKSYKYELLKRLKPKNLSGWGTLFSAIEEAT